jgi:hypothetical protein
MFEENSVNLHPSSPRSGYISNGTSGALQSLHFLHDQVSEPLDPKEAFCMHYRPAASKSVPLNPLGNGSIHGSHVLHLEVSHPGVSCHPKT